MPYNRIVMSHFLSLKERRIKAKYTQKEVAQALGYASPQVVSHIERNEHTLSPSELLQLLLFYKKPKSHKRALKKAKKGKKK